MIEIFLADLFLLPSSRYLISERGEGYLHNKLGYSTRESAGRALEDCPMKAVPEDRRKKDENYYRKDEIVKKMETNGIKTNANNVIVTTGANTAGNMALFMIFFLAGKNTTNFT